jgi:hypothetical protein
MINPSLLDNASFSFSEKDNSNLQSNWVLIVDWPGLDKIYPVKVTRAITESTIVTEFGDHALCCPQYMDKVIYSLKNRTLGFDAEYIFFLQTVVKYLQSPNPFSVVDEMSFDDFMVNEYCNDLINKFIRVNAVSFQGQQSKDKFKNRILPVFKSKRNKRKEKESYLNTTFAEDILRSRAELMKLMKA